MSKFLALAILATQLSMTSASYSDAQAKDCSIGSKYWIVETVCTKGRGKCV